MLYIIFSIVFHSIVQYSILEYSGICLKFEFQLPQRPGAGANWEAFLLFRAHFLVRFWYLAYVTLFLGKIDAPVTEQYQLPLVQGQKTIYVSLVSLDKV